MEGIVNLPKIKIVDPKKTSDFLNINADDFDPKTMIKWEDRDDEPKKKPGPKPKAKTETTEEQPDHRI